jgi:uncharacterized protein YeaO (DUF488 family)
MIEVKRLYGPGVREGTGPAGKKEGSRFLVDRLWPRGVKKEALKLDAWLKDAAPSDELRHWFKHDPEKWPEFRRRYFAELDAHPAAWASLLKAARRERVTLLFSSKELAHNNAVALKEYIESHLKKRSPGRG